MVADIVIYKMMYPQIVRYYVSNVIKNDTINIYVLPLELVISRSCGGL